MSNTVNLSTVYRSKTRFLSEVLNADVFEIEDSVEGRCNEDDLGLITKFEEIVREQIIPYAGTYFIINIGHAHLVGIGEHLLRQGVEPYFMIPGKAHARMQQTLKYWRKNYESAKQKLETLVGFATLIDCHRDEYDERYSLTELAFPSPQKLKKAGIKRVVYMNEGSGILKKPHGVYANPVLKGVIEEYENAGLEFLQFGIWPIQLESIIYVHPFFQ